MKKIVYTLAFVLIVSYIFNVENCIAQWTQKSISGQNIITSLGVKSTSILAGTLSGGLYVSSDNGSAWSNITSNIGDPLVRAITVAGGSTIYIGTDGSGIYKSTNTGANWTLINTGLVNKTVNAISIINGYLYAGTDSGVYRSTNGGTNWSSRGLTSYKIYSISSYDIYIFAGTANGVYSNINDGITWTQVLTNSTIKSVIHTGTYLFAASFTDGVFKSTNNGTNWVQINDGLPQASVCVIGYSSNYLFAGLSVSPYGCGVYFSTNDGANWLQRNEGFTGNFRVESFIFANYYIFAGTTTSSVWRRSFDNIISKSNFISSDVPSSYSLGQNYPNPFNPTTNVQFSIPNVQYVTLKVYDMLGKEVETLVNEKLEAGTYSVDWNAGNFPSGVYFYKLRAEGYTETKRMILLK